MNSRLPNIRITELRNDFVSFELSNTDVSVANSLRRIMISEVPTLAIELVEFEENSTCLQDEFLAHRLGLVPLRSKKPMSEWNFAHDCDEDCEGNCEKCSVEFELTCNFDDLIQTLPPEEQSKEIKITSRDLVLSPRSRDSGVEVVHFSNEDEEYESHDKGIMLVKIGPGQRLKLKAIAVKGIGKEHTKWSPVGTVALKYDPVITLNEEILDEYTEEEKRKLVDCCPTQVFRYEEMSETVAIDDAASCIFCKECLFTTEDFRRRPEAKLAVDVQHSTNKFTLTVESNGALTASEVVLDAIHKQAEKIRKLQESIPELAVTP